MKSKKNVIICIIVIVVLAVGLILFLSLNKARQENKNNMELIRKNYQLLSDSVSKYNDIRSKYNEMSSVLIIDSYKEKHEEYVELLDNYNKEVENIDNYINNIDLRCKGTYNDDEINEICDKYKGLFEKLVNLYIADIDNYNKFITEYNEVKDDKLELVEKVYQNYIDYNNDGVYEGSDNSEETEDKE